MPGETELARLLSGLEPVLDETQYVFVCVNNLDAMLPVKNEVRGVFVESESVTLIVPATTAEAMDWHYDGIFRCITCNIHSSLEAVGLTAAMSAALTEAGISANVVAAYYHDHLFVPASDANQALSALRALSAC